MATVRIYKVAEVLGTSSQEVMALLKQAHGIEVKSASSTIEEVVARQFVERLARQRGVTLPPPSRMFEETPTPAKGKKAGGKAPEPPKPTAPPLPPPRLIKTIRPYVPTPVEGAVDPLYATAPGADAPTGIEAAHAAFERRTEAEHEASFEAAEATFEAVSDAPFAEAPQDVEAPGRETEAPAAPEAVTEAPVAGPVEVVAEAPAEAAEASAPSRVPEAAAAVEAPPPAKPPAEAVRPMAAAAAQPLPRGGWFRRRSGCASKTPMPRAWRARRPRRATPDPARRRPHRGRPRRPRYPRCRGSRSADRARSPRHP